MKTNIMSKSINETESLEIIREMIDKAKGNVRNDSNYYLLWGWLVFFSSLGHYILLRLDFAMPWLTWVILMPLGGFAAGYMGYKQSKKQKTSGYSDKLMTYLWSAFVVTMIIALLNGPNIGWEVSYSILIALYGLATFVSGGILRFKPLIYGGISAWVISIFSFYAPMEYLLLLMALSMVTSYLIPGYLLKRSAHAA